MRPVNSDNRPTPDKIAGGNGVSLLLNGFVSKMMRRVSRKVQSVISLRTVSLRSVCVFASLAAAAGALYGTSAGSSFRNSVMSKVGFTADSLVLNGNELVDRQGVEFALAEQMHGSMFSFNSNAARENLLKNPWLKQASVHKVYPDTIVVDIVEREPFAFWTASDVVTLIARDGVVLGQASSEHMRLPQVVGKGANVSASEFVSVITKFPAISDRASAFVRVADRRWDVVLRNGPKVLLPESNWKGALAKLDRLQTTKGILDRELVLVDLRLPDRLVLRLEEGAAAERREYLEKLLKRDWHRT